jgi:hypothetical protein
MQSISIYFDRVDLRLLVGNPKLIHVAVLFECKAYRTAGHSALLRSSRETGFPVTCPPAL